MKDILNFSELKKVLKKIWNFLIHDNSAWSFIADAIIIYFLGKFILFPVIGLILGTSLPAVSVLSSSMDHHGMDFEDWWIENAELYEEKDIIKEQFENFKFKNGFSRGDALILIGAKQNEITVGDVIVFSSPEGPIIHRVISLEPFATKGDANPSQLYFEKEILESQVKGKAVVWIPLAGWPKALLEDLKALAK